MARNILQTFPWQTPFHKNFRSSRAFARSSRECMIGSLVAHISRAPPCRPAWSNFISSFLCCLVHELGYLRYGTLGKGKNCKTLAKHEIQQDPYEPKVGRVHFSTLGDLVTTLALKGQVSSGKVRQGPSEPSDHSFMYSFTYPSIHPSMHPSIHPSVRPSIHL